MKKIFILFIVFITWIDINAAIISSNNTNTLAPVLNQIMPAVVNISVRGQLPPMPAPIGRYSRNERSNRSLQIAPKFEGIGSGIIVNAEYGVILTNAHILKDVKIITVTLNDGRRIQGRILGMDAKSDIAVIQINARHLTAISLADSDQVKVGDFVAAIGNPFGLSQTVTSGVVSALDRGDLGIEGYGNFIQIDAPINPGNSGGALINMEGKLIGLNTAIITPYSTGGSVGIGLAIPSNMCKNVMDQVLKYGKVEHGMLGVLVQNVTPALAAAMALPDTKGALISQILPGSPAEKMGLKPQDIILELNHKQIINASQVSATIGLLKPGTTVDLKVRSSGKIRSLLIVISSAEAQQALAAKIEKPLLSGLAFMDINQLENNQITKGVMVLDVDDFSFARSCGLRQGDIIISANNQPITKIEQLQKIASEHSNALLLNIKRDGANIFLVLEK